MSSNRIQWLLGAAIVLMAAYMLFGRAEETPSSLSAPIADLPISPDDIPLPPADLPIKLVDAKTKACMADTACMQEFFLKITLGNEYEPRSTTDPRINKWQIPINYRVYGWDQLDQAQSSALKQALIDMTRIASTVDLGLGPSTRGINVIAMLTEDMEADLEGRFSELADKAFRPVPGFLEEVLSLPFLSPSCAINVAPTTEGTIAYVGMFANTRLTPTSLKRCIYEEFSQMLGLYNDVADDIDSLYTDQAHRRELTEFDFLLLRLLYHPRIEPGMNEDEVIAVFPEVYRTTIETPVLHQAAE